MPLPLLAGMAAAGVGASMIPGYTHYVPIDDDADAPAKLEDTTNDAPRVADGE